MPSSDERKMAITALRTAAHPDRYSPPTDDQRLDALIALGWDSRNAEVQQLREERDGWASRMMEFASAQQERDRYAAVIEKAYRCLTGPMHPEDQREFAIAVLASVASGSALAERDAEKWDEGHSAGHSDYVGTDGTWPTTPNPYRAEQIRKEGKSNG